MLRSTHVARYSLGEDILGNEEGEGELKGGRGR